MRYLVRPVVAAFALALAASFATGCASTQNMSAEQLRAVAADKNFSAVCSNVTGVYGMAKTVYVNVDRTVVVNGGISVDPNTCAITMTNAPVPKTETAPAKPAAP